MNDPSLRLRPTTSTTKRAYILNVAAKVAHRVIIENGQRFSLEQCQIDDIKKRRNSDTYPKSYRPCEHCMVPE